MRRRSCAPTARSPSSPRAPPARATTSPECPRTRCACDVSLVVDEHRLYLSDANRLDAFRRAIEAVVRPGDVVLDLACGTGILGLMACRAGASRVYALDDGGILDVARQAARANGFGDRIVHVKAYSRHATLPERVDVVVA